MDKNKAHQIADQIIDNSAGLAVLTAMASIKLRDAIASALIAAHDGGERKARMAESVRRIGEIVEDEGLPY